MIISHIWYIIYAFNAQYILAIYSRNIQYCKVNVHTLHLKRYLVNIIMLYMNIMVWFQRIFAINFFEIFPRDNTVAWGIYLAANSKNLSPFTVSQNFEFHEKMNYRKISRQVNISYTLIFTPSQTRTSSPTLSQSLPNFQRNFSNKTITSILPHLIFTLTVRASPQFTPNTYWISYSTLTSTSPHFNSTPP